MKKISLFLMVILLLGSYSCSKVDKTTIKSPAGAPVLNLQDGAVIVLNKADKDVVITYTWSKADFGTAVVVTYNLQMDKKGNNFANPLSMGVVAAATSLSVTTDFLNNKLLSMEADPTMPIALEIEFRVQATVSTYYTPSNSAVITQSLTPYYVPIAYPLLFVPGDYQGWNPADSSTSIASVNLNDKYEGYIWFGHDNTQFKYTQGPAWTTNWGDDGADGTLNPNGANIVAGPKGYYKLNVDLPALTHKFLRTEWSVIGDAAGSWDIDRDMAYDSIAKTWSVTLPLTAAFIKFRANHDWTLNYGDNTGNGTLQEGGTNIAVPSAGNYKVILNLSQPIYRYKLELQK